MLRIAKHCEYSRCSLGLSAGKPARKRRGWVGKMQNDIARRCQGSPVEYARLTAPAQQFAGHRLHRMPATCAEGHYCTRRASKLTFLGLPSPGHVQFGAPELSEYGFSNTMLGKINKISR